VTERPQGQDRCTKSMRACCRPGAQQRSMTNL
jgi:hypothetical protein